jgi:hypothetical protein
VIAHELLRDGLAQAVWMVAPAAGAAVAAALLVGWLAQRLGVHDPVPVLVARAAAVLAVLWLCGASWMSESAGWTRELWQALPAIGQGRG